MSAIAPQQLRRQDATQKMHRKVEILPDNIPLKQTITNAPNTTRLKSCKPFYKSYKKNFDINTEWRTQWDNRIPAGGNLVTDPTQPLPGFDSANRSQWVTANRLRCRHARTAVNMYRWNLADSPICPAYRNVPQNTDHLVLECPMTKIPGGYETINECGAELQKWISDNVNVKV